MLRPSGGSLDRTITNADDKTALPSITIEKNSIHYQIVSMLKLVKSLAAKAKKASPQPLCSSPLAIVTVMCRSCVEIDKQVERYRELLRSLTEQVEVERINQLIARLYADRVRLHRNPEQ